jgi:hypothetical protein
MAAVRMFGIYQSVHHERGFVVALSGLVLCAWCGWVSGFHLSVASLQSELLAMRSPHPSM